ncbi:LysR substrate-binding domain-containing protein [Streptomyces sp. SID4956]|uniref:LysR substrate-binding domain-containing protein n=1 Tax=Streptomyces sp. SID4956 TaxID=2690290 RepID=UPI00136F6F00|nr:hypothetical protein [Streptomyces sp. SID4956]
MPWTWRSPTTSTDPCPACGARDATCGGSPLTEDPLHVVLPGTHPLGGRPVLNLAGLADEPWVLGCLKTEGYLRCYAEQAGFSPDVRGSTTDYFFARSLVAAGVGLSLIPTVALTPALPGVRSVPLDAPTPARHIGAAVLRRPARPEVTTLIEALRQHGEATAPPGPPAAAGCSGRPASPLNGHAGSGGWISGQTRLSCTIGCGCRERRRAAVRPGQPGGHARPVLVAPVLRGLVRRCAAPGGHRSGRTERGRPWARVNSADPCPRLRSEQS